MVGEKPRAGGRHIECNTESATEDDKTFNDATEANREATASVNVSERAKRMGDSTR